MRDLRRQALRFRSRFDFFIAAPTSSSAAIFCAPAITAAKAHDAQLVPDALLFALRSAKWMPRPATTQPLATLPFARFFLLGAALIAAASLAQATENNQNPTAEKPTAPNAADKPAEPADAAKARSSDPKNAAGLKTEGETVKMPVFTVTGQRLREIDVTIKKLEKQISREKKQLEKSNLDETLNSEKVAKAASIFGGKSTVQRASVAAVRIESMEKELQLLETLRTPLTKDDRAMIERLVEDQRTYRRNLDDALR